jgi:hypothetical protein
MPAEPPGLAIHIGADILTDPAHARWAPQLSCVDTIERASRLAVAAGITQQQALTGTRATREQVRHALRSAAAQMGHGGQLLLTFTGHSDSGATDSCGPGDVSWCLHDGTLRLAEVADALNTLPPASRVVVISDTCYAAALSRFPISATLALIAACEAHQQILARPATTFVARLEQLVLPRGQRNPHCTSYSWLDRRLRQDTPDVERPCVWASKASIWAERPFHPWSLAAGQTGAAMF